MGLIKFVTVADNRLHHFFLAVVNFPFWAVLVIATVSYIVSTVRASYLFRLSRTLHLQHSHTAPSSRRPSRPTVVTNPAEVTERDITSATPNSANYFRHV